MDGGEMQVEERVAWEIHVHDSDERFMCPIRRELLAHRMMAHGARTEMVVEWSGLSVDQVTTRRRRWGFDPAFRRRGPAPTAFHAFFKTRG